MRVLIWFIRHDLRISLHIYFNPSSTLDKCSGKIPGVVISKLHIVDTPIYIHICWYMCSEPPMKMIDGFTPLICHRVKKGSVRFKIQYSLDILSYVVRDYPHATNIPSRLVSCPLYGFFSPAHMYEQCNHCMQSPQRRTAAPRGFIAQDWDINAPVWVDPLDPGSPLGVLSPPPPPRHLSSQLTVPNVCHLLCGPPKASLRFCQAWLRRNKMP